MANWLNLDALRQWDFSQLSFFQYDSVTDAQIKDALRDSESLEKIDSSIDWEDDRWLASASIPEELKHAYRVAVLVKELQAGGAIRESIWLDTFNNGQCGCCIGNGHHRIRALQYIGCPAAPFALQGFLDPLEDLVRLAGVRPDPAWLKWFTPELFSVSPDDVVLDENAVSSAP